MSVLTGPSQALSSELRPELEQILQAAIAITGDFGNLQLLDPASRSLKIVAQRGFAPDFLSFFNSTHEGQAACGTALLHAKRVVVADVANDPIFHGTESLAVMLRAGARAVHSTPLLGRRREPVGVLSCHYSRPTLPTAWDLRLIEKLATEAAEIVQSNGVRPPSSDEDVPPPPHTDDESPYALFLQDRRVR